MAGFPLISSFLLWAASVPALAQFRPEIALAPQPENRAPARVIASLKRIATTPSGKQLLLEMKQPNGQRQLPKLTLQLGPISKTDSVMSRSLDPTTGQESLQKEITIQLKQTLRDDALLMDLVHELVHAVRSQDLDPYAPELTATRYIRHAIEGPGGEIEAVQAECQVAEELGVAHPSPERCGTQDQMLQSFYRIGKYFKQWATLGLSPKDFPALSQDEPVLISSTGGAPYPISLAQEYSELNESVCRNTRRRLRELLRTSTGTTTSKWIREGTHLLGVRCQRSVAIQSNRQ